MLVVCPECGKKISDKSPYCVHCGFPISINNQNICEINNEQYDLSNLLDIINGDEIYQGSRLIRSIRFLDDKCKLGLDDAKRLYYEVEASKIIPSSFTPTNRPQTIRDYTPKCPKCGSTAITTGARGVNGFWGFIGASKTVNRCGNCGHSWTPKG